MVTQKADYLAFCRVCLSTILPINHFSGSIAIVTQSNKDKQLARTNKILQLDMKQMRSKNVKRPAISKETLVQMKIIAVCVLKEATTKFKS